MAAQAETAGAHHQGVDDSCQGTAGACTGTTGADGHGAVSSHISELRSATEKEKAAQAKAAAATQPALPANQSGLSFDLTDPGRPVDLVPTFDPSTVLSNELVLENLLRGVSREGIRYVGILATDVKDTLFPGGAGARPGS